MKRTNWYFRGYQRVEEPKKNGKGVTHRLVYKGEWYGFPGGKKQGRRVKLECGLLSALVLGIYLYAQLNPSLGGRVGWLGATSLLALIPMMVEVAAFANFLPAGEKWEYRVYHGGYRRLFRAGCVLAGLLAVWLVMELWFILRFPDFWKKELTYLLSILICLAAQAGVLIILRRNPVEILEEAQENAC